MTTLSGHRPYVATVSDFPSPTVVYRRFSFSRALSAHSALPERFTSTTRGGAKSGEKIELD